MVGAADGARHNAEGCFRVERYVLWICKECCREDSCHARVLHADFYRNGALLGGAELEQTTNAIAEHITESVVAEHDGEHERQKSKAVCQKVRTHSHDNATDDQCKADNAHGGHVRLEFLEACALAKKVVAGEADCNRENGHVKDVEKHADGVHFDARVREPKDQKRSHERSEERACHGHAHGIRHIAFSQETHNVARNTARTATDENNADGQIRVKPEDLRECKRDKRHDGVLRDCAEEDVAGTFHQVADVVHGNGEAHAEHDDAENNRACVAVNPAKERGNEKRNNRACDDEKRCVCR